jgi:hypothetical protein
MAKKPDKWADAEANLSADEIACLRQLKTDYINAARLRVPTWTGGPSAEILAELVRLGWRK